MMTVFVVDTNVAVVANGRSPHIDKKCRLRCVRELRRLMTSEIVAVDNGWLIMGEYGRSLKSKGPLGVGDAFYKHLLNDRRGEKVLRVPVTPSDDNGWDFEELPENDKLDKFDRSDRKFLVVALVAEAVVLNAADSDWNQHKALMKELKVQVEELCPQHIKGLDAAVGGTGEGALPGSPPRKA